MLRLGLACSTVAWIAVLAGCGASERSSSAPAAPPTAPAVVVSDRGGTPAIGPGTMYNACERIWCMEHGENYAFDHFEKSHVGWIVHDDAHGDVFVPRGRTGGPEFVGARRAALRLCGRHVHPFLLAKSPVPIRDRGFRVALGYDRGHFHGYGIRLEPCCVNGQGWGYLHAPTPRQFRFDDVATYRGTSLGWQRPFSARAPAPR